MLYNKWQELKAIIYTTCHHHQATAVSQLWHAAGDVYKAKVLSELQGSIRWRYLHFGSPQPDTSRSCKSTDTELMCRMECLFSSQLVPVPIYTGWRREACVWATCPELLRGRGVEQLGWLPNHYATPYITYMYIIYHHRISLEVTDRFEEI